MKQRTPEFDKLVIETYLENHSAYKTGKRLGVSHKYVYRVLHAEGVAVPGWSDEKPNRRKLSDAQVAEAVSDYESGVSFKVMSEKFGCSDWAIRSAIKRSGAKRRLNGGQPRIFSTHEKSEMISLFENGWTQTALCAKFNTSQASVSRVLRDAGVCINAHRSGENHGSWKGGVIKNQYGYRLVLVPPNHKFSCMRTSTGYVLEHRLVMAETLGRPLHKYETVHHINGNREDNRPENLQVRKGKHGTGVVMQCACCGSYDVREVRIAEAA